MKKYKHKSTGKTCTEKDTFYYIDSEGNLPKWIVEDSCDWEEILSNIPEYVKCIKSYTGKEIGTIYKSTDRPDWFRNYESVEEFMRTKNRNCWFTPSRKAEYDAQFKKYEILDTGCSFNIIKIKRVSDGEIFSIGDKIDIGLGESTIEKIEINNKKEDEDYPYDIIIYYECGHITNNKELGAFKDMKKCRIPLFYTEDNNVPVYEGDDVYYVSNMHNPYGIWCKISKATYPMDVKYFSTKQAAEEYISINKILFITEDGVEIKRHQKYCVVSIRDYSLMYLDLEASENSNAANGIGDKYGKKYFSTEEKAQEFIDNNKPQYSLKDVEQMFIDSGYNIGYYRMHLNKLKNLKK